jgi:ATP-dependent DNA helicase PIF1
MDDLIDLEQVHRQKDSDFVSLLRRMRIGELSEDDKKVLFSRVNATLKDDGIKATSLFAQNVDVDRLNFSEQEKLKTRRNVFELRNGCKKSGSRYGGSQATDVQNLQRLQETLIKEVGLPSSLELRIGAQVMLVHNLDVQGGLVNGSRGVVIGFAKTSKEDPERDFDPEPLGSNKKEGTDRNLYYPDDPLPIVKFASLTPGGKQRAIEIPFVRWEKTEKKVGEAWVTALPLKLAWSSTIHKCQGSSLDRVEVAIDKTVFAYGQAYVALSRVTTLDGLTLKSFDPSVVRAHPAALEFFKSNFNDLKSARFPAKTVKAAAKVVKPVATTTTKKRTRSLEDLTAFAPVVMNAEQVMASEARMLEIFALQRLQDEQDEDED